MYPVLCLYKCFLLCCGICSVPASWNISNKLSLFIYLLSQSYCIWQNLVMWPYSKIVGGWIFKCSAPYVPLQPFTSFQKAKRFYPLITHWYVMMESCFFWKTIRKLLGGKNVAFWKVSAGGKDLQQKSSSFWICSRSPKTH